MISSLLKELNIDSKFDEATGVRVSDAKVVRAASFALSAVNKNLSYRISKQSDVTEGQDVKALGLDGRDGRLLQCKVVENGRLGNVGEIVKVNTQLLRGLVESAIPIISPIGCALDDKDDTVFNVNADVAAGTIARAMECAATVFLTDIAGVMDRSRKVLPKLTKREVDELIEKKVITGGMIPKVNYAVQAARKEGQRAVIADGRVEHAVVKEVFKLCGVEVDGAGGGTTITAE